MFYLKFEKASEKTGSLLAGPVVETACMLCFMLQTACGELLEQSSDCGLSGTGRRHPSPVTTRNKIRS